MQWQIMHQQIHEELSLKCVFFFFLSLWLTLPRSSSLQHATRVTQLAGTEHSPPELLKSNIRHYLSIKLIENSVMIIVYCWSTRMGRILFITCHNFIPSLQFLRFKTLQHSINNWGCHLQNENTKNRLFSQDWKSKVFSTNPYSCPNKPKPRRSQTSVSSPFLILLYPLLVLKTSIA